MVYSFLRPMPVILIVGPYRFVIYSTDRGEPPHIHVARGRDLAKFWLDERMLAKSKGFADHELNAIARLVVEHREIFRKAWDDYFGT